MYKVLVVEDEALIRKGLAYTVDWLKWRCVVAGEAADGREGLEKIRQIHPDIVVTDIRMPCLSGLEMIQKAQEEGERFCAIVISSYSEFEYARSAIHLGVNEYLLKPIEDEKLEEAVLRIVELFGKDAARQTSLEFPAVPATHENFYVAEAMRLIQSGYRTKLTIEDVAARLGVSTSYLSRKIKRTMNMTFLDLLNRYRIIKAGELLRTGKYRVYEAADKIGFTNYKYFCTVFKRYTGYAPSQFLHERR